MGVAAGLMAAGQVIGGIQADQTSIAQKKAYDQNANLAELQGNDDALTSMRQSRMQDGEMVAAGASAGGGAMGGSLADIVYANAVQRQATAQNIRYSADMKAQGLRYQGSVARAQGRQALFGSLLKAGASVAGSTGGGGAGGAQTQPLGTIPVPQLSYDMTGF